MQVYEVRDKRVALELGFQLRKMARLSKREAKFYAAELALALVASSLKPEQRLALLIFYAIILCTSVCVRARVCVQHHLHTHNLVPKSCELDAIALDNDGHLVFDAAYQNLVALGVSEDDGRSISHSAREVATRQGDDVSLEYAAPEQILAAMGDTRPRVLPMSIIPSCGSSGELLRSSSSSPSLSIVVSWF